MLIEFRVANHRSIRDEQALTMTAAPRLGDAADLIPRDVGLGDKLLPVAAIYGANASGKSNVLAALSWMRDAVMLSQRAWGPDEGVPRDPFAWGKPRAEPSVFEVTFVEGDVRYEYGFAVTDERVEEEWLEVWPENRKQLWFSREQQQFRFGSHFSDNQVIREATRPNALFLSTAVQLQHKQLQPAFRWFRLLETAGIANLRGPRFGMPREWMVAEMIQARTVGKVQRRLFEVEEDEDALFERFRKLMRSADIGVLDFRTVTSGDSDPPRPRSPNVQLKHASDVDEAWLSLEEESRGTRTLYGLAMPILRAIDHGGILLVDELESSLHPKIAQEIVRQFNDPATNPRHAQLIFTTHDTNLLGTSNGDAVLRRDEVWLTEKNDKGATELYPLTNYKPRASENLERGYLQGRYNAIPYLGEFSIAPEEH